MDILLNSSIYSLKLFINSVKFNIALYILTYLFINLFKLTYLGIITSGSAFSAPVIWANISFSILVSSLETLDIFLVRTLTAI